MANAGLAGMATKITANGHLALPEHVRETLQLSPGDAVEFGVNGNGEVVLRKAPAESADGQRGQPVHPRHEAQMRRRAEELVALLRGLD
jgi:AbrB family looped-hinge helix DNA binding protein